MISDERAPPTSKVRVSVLGAGSLGKEHVRIYGELAAAGGDAFRCGQTPFATGQSCAGGKAYDRQRGASGGIGPTGAPEQVRPASRPRRTIQSWFQVSGDRG